MLTLLLLPSAVFSPTATSGRRHDSTTAIAGWIKRAIRACATMVSAYSRTSFASIKPCAAPFFRE
jgi:hypothetical protein